MSRGRKPNPVNYTEEIERVNMRITHHENSIKELEEVFAKAIKLSSAKEIKDLYVQYAKSKGLWSLIGERKN